MSHVYLKNKTSSAITVAGYSVYYIDKTDAEIVEVEGTIQRPLPSVGDTITFGNYPQATNDPEPIEWMVLEVDSVNGRAFLLSKKVLDCQPYNTNSAYVTWKTCSLRAWLNSTFLNAAFDSAEQDMISLSHVETPNNGASSGGDPTDDKLFNLSIQEAANSAHFATASARRALGTQYAINAGATSSSGYVAWWTRSPGNTSLSTATRVANNSSATFYNTNVEATTIGIRPAMWLSFVSIIKYNAFKYSLSGVPYWYVIDGVQADWTDDLSSIGYSEVAPPPIETTFGDPVTIPAGYHVESVKCQRLYVKASTVTHGAFNQFVSFVFEGENQYCDLSNTALIGTGVAPCLTILSLQDTSGSGYWISWRSGTTGGIVVNEISNKNLNSNGVFCSATVQCPVTSNADLVANGLRTFPALFRYYDSNSTIVPYYFKIQRSLWQFQNGVFSWLGDTTDSSDLAYWYNGRAVQIILVRDE